MSAKGPRMEVRLLSSAWIASAVRAVRKNAWCVTKKSYLLTLPSPLYHRLPWCPDLAVSGTAIRPFQAIPIV
jgi:hypothetical protein